MPLARKALPKGGAFSLSQNVLEYQHGNLAYYREYIMTEKFVEFSEFIKEDFWKELKIAVGMIHDAYECTQDEAAALLFQEALDRMEQDVIPYITSFEEADHAYMSCISAIDGVYERKCEGWEGFSDAFQNRADEIEVKICDNIDEYAGDWHDHEATNAIVRHYQSCL